MPDPSVLLKCGERYKDAYEELQARFESASRACAVDELRAIEQEALDWGLDAHDNCPDIVWGSNPFYDLANQVRAYITACYTPETCDEIGCRTGPSWADIDRWANNVNCALMDHAFQIQKELPDDLFNRGCPKPCQNLAQEKADAMESWLQENCWNGPPPAPELKADFSWSVKEWRETFIVDFESTSSAPEDDPITEFWWDFGDGEEGRGLTVRHSYTEEGIFPVTLTIYTQSGQGRQVVKDVQLRFQKLVACSFDYETAPHGDWIKAYFWNTSEVRDPDDYVEYCQFDFGDGTWAEGCDVTHIYEQPGEFIVTLQILTFKSIVKECQKTITIELPLLKPVAEFTWDVSPEDGTWIVDFYDASVSDERDPIVSWQWDFGDGYGHSYQNPTHIYRDKGPWVTTLKITTQAGQEAIVSHIIELE